VGSSNYKPDRRGFSEMASQASIGQAMVDAAQRGASYAESISPVETGEYKGSFHVRPAIVGEGLNRRAGAILENDSDHAFPVEYQDDFRILQRTIDEIERG
jgi:hypothetical protein